MSSATPQSAPVALETKRASLLVERTHSMPHPSTWRRPDSNPARQLRNDAAHDSPPSPRGLLSWTTYVLHQQPATPPQEQGREQTDDQVLDRLPGTAVIISDAPSSSNAHVSSSVQAGPVALDRASSLSPSLSLMRSANAKPSVAARRTSDTALGVHRQRFYPAQWRSSIQPRIDTILKQHGHSLQWLGWDRSLPRLYLPIERLNRAILELLQGVVRKANLPDAGGGRMTLKAAWQTGACQSMVWTLEHPDLALSPALVATMNGPGRGSVDGISAGAHALLRAYQHVVSLGGSMWVNSSPQGGTWLRITLPVDDHRTLVARWIEQMLDTGHGASRPAFHLHLVGRRGGESRAALDAADARLQSLASADDYIYRVGCGRWLWLTTADQLPGFVQRDAWRSQQVASWRCNAASIAAFDAHPNSRLAVNNQPSDASQFVQLSQQLAASIAKEVDRLIGKRVPPIDSLIPVRTTHVAARSGRWRVDAGNPLRLGTSRSPLSARKRWRYPI